MKTAECEKGNDDNMSCNYVTRLLTKSFCCSLIACFNGSECESKTIDGYALVPA